MSSTVIFSGPAELTDHVGCELGATDWVKIRQRDINDFARVTRDRQWIHVDPSRAAKGPFGGPIAHGYYTLSLCSYFIARLLVVRGVRMVVNYGLERVRFPAPVPIGSRVRAGGQIIAVSEREDATQTTTRLTVEIEGGPKPACVADQVSLFYPA
jgi:acyl dehydratase